MMIVADGRPAYSCRAAVLPRSSRRAKSAVKDPIPTTNHAPPA